jgi:RimJ/RimL family protein N-acetyltransferase
MSLAEFLSFLRLLLFRNDEILIYCCGLTEADAGALRSSPMLIVKGQLPDLELERRERRPVPWELQCDVYDGVRDFFVYIEAGRVGHVSWLYYKNDPNRILQLDEGECEVKFCLTFPEFRGQGLYAAALRVIQVYLKERGLHRCFICVKSDNIASIRGIEKAGFRRVGATRLRKVLGLQVSKPRPTRQLVETPEARRWIA